MNNKEETLLLVEDDKGVREQLEWYFSDFKVITAHNRSSAVAAVRREEPQVISLDLGLPPDPDGVSEGLATLKEILSIAPHTKVIVVTGNGDQENAVRAVGLGAYDFYQKPIEVNFIELVIKRAFKMFALEDENLRLSSVYKSMPIDGIITTSKSMLHVCRIIEKIAPTNVTALLLGESGTGKELLARAIHRQSSRTEEGFVAINCAAIPDALLESELFGYEKGAFTGADKQTLGKIDYANHGTLFLDEIGDMPLPLQAKLLRFLQERRIERVGGRKEIPVDVRVVCATNQNLMLLIEEGKFREDLFYRIGEVLINIPPLRDRDSDAIIIARAFVGKYTAEYGKSIRGMTEDAVKAVETYSWPGNIRELENKIKGAVLLAESGYIKSKDLGLEADTDGEPASLNLRHLREQVEREAIQKALVLEAGNVTRAAELLGITRPTFYSMLNKYQIEMPEHVSAR